MRPDDEDNDGRDRGKRLLLELPLPLLVPLVAITFLSDADLVEIGNDNPDSKWSVTNGSVSSDVASLSWITVVDSSARREAARSIDWRSESSTLVVSCGIIKAVEGNFVSIRVFGGEGCCFCRFTSLLVRFVVPAAAVVIALRDKEELEYKLTNSSIVIFLMARIITGQ